MASAQDVLNVARRNLGFVEGPRNNENPYAAVVGHANFQPWCASFVAACFRTAGITLPSESAYTPTMANGFKQQGSYRKGSPKVGDVVFFFWPNMGRIAHVGIVETVNADGSVTCLEGNTNAGGSRTGGMVCRIVRRANIDGFGTPVYGPSEPKTTWQQGDNDPGVGHIQRRLRAHGIQVNVDNDFGPATKGAVVSFQKSRGLAGGGIVGPTTLGLLNEAPKGAPAPAPKPAPKPVVRNPHAVPVLSSARPYLSASGRKTKAEVKFIQWAVREKEDGVWGSDTSAGVRAFQQAKKMTVDAKVGPKTLAALKSVTR